jgi:hypothetical protein
MSSVMELAMAAYRRGLKNPEQVTEALEAIIRDQERYLARRSRQGEEGAQSFNAEVARRNETLARAIMLIDSRADELAQRERYAAHVLRHALPGIPEGVLKQLIDTLPLLPTEDT